MIHASKTEKKNPVVYLLDPTADADHVGLHLKATDSLPAAARQSPRALADHDFRENLVKSLQDAKLRPNSWKPYNISGRPGVAFIADYTESGKSKVLLSIYAVGPKTCENFTLACAPDKLDGLTKSLDQIIASYRTTK